MEKSGFPKIRDKAIRCDCLGQHGRAMNLGWPVGDSGYLHAIADKVATLPQSGVTQWQPGQHRTPPARVPSKKQKNERGEQGNQ